MKAIASPDGDTEGRPPLVTRGAGCCAPSCDAEATTMTSSDLENMAVGRLRCLTLRPSLNAEVDGRCGSCSELMIAAMYATIRQRRTSVTTRLTTSDSYPLRARNA